MTDKKKTLTTISFQERLDKWLEENEFHISDKEEYESHIEH